MTTIDQSEMQLQCRIRFLKEETSANPYCTASWIVLNRRFRSWLKWNSVNTFLFSTCFPADNGLCAPASDVLIKSLQDILNQMSVTINKTGLCGLQCKGMWAYVRMYHTSIPSNQLDNLYSCSPPTDGSHSVQFLLPKSARTRCKLIRKEEKEKERNDNENQHRIQFLKERTTTNQYCTASWIALNESFEMWLKHRGLEVFLFYECDSIPTIIQEVLNQMGVIPNQTGLCGLECKGIWAHIYIAESKEQNRWYFVQEPLPKKRHDMQDKETDFDRTTKQLKLVKDAEIELQKEKDNLRMDFLQDACVVHKNKNYIASWQVLEFCFRQWLTKHNHFIFSFSDFYSEKSDLHYRLPNLDLIETKHGMSGLECIGSFSLVPKKSKMMQLLLPVYGLNEAKTPNETKSIPTPNETTPAAANKAKPGEDQDLLRIGFLQDVTQIETNLSFIASWEVLDFCFSQWLQKQNQPIFTFSAFMKDTKEVSSSSSSSSSSSFCTSSSNSPFIPSSSLLSQVLEFLHFQPKEIGLFGLKCIGSELFTSVPYSETQFLQLFLQTNEVKKEEANRTNGKQTHSRLERKFPILHEILQMSKATDTPIETILKKRYTPNATVPYPKAPLVEEFNKLTSLLAKKHVKEQTETCIVCDQIVPHESCLPFEQHWNKLDFTYTFACKQSYVCSKMCHIVANKIDTGCKLNLVHQIAQLNEKEIDEIKTALKEGMFSLTETDGKPDAVVNELKESYEKMEEWLKVENPTKNQLTDLKQIHSTFDLMQLFWSILFANPPIFKYDSYIIMDHLEKTNDLTVEKLISFLQKTEWILPEDLQPRFYKYIHDVIQRVGWTKSLLKVIQQKLTTAQIWKLMQDIVSNLTDDVSKKALEEAWYPIHFCLENNYDDWRKMIPLFHPEWVDDKGQNILHIAARKSLHCFIDVCKMLDTNVCCELLQDPSVTKPWIF